MSGRATCRRFGSNKMPTGRLLVESDRETRVSVTAGKKIEC